MPKFPTYRGELPKCLNPFNPCHYLLLLYWIFFRPTGLKYFLYQVEPKFCHSEPRWKIFSKTWRIPTYRNLYLMIPIASILLSILLSLPLTFLLSLILDIATNWSKWIYGLVGGVTISIVIGAIGSLKSNIATGIILELTSGLMFGIISSIMIGIILNNPNIVMTVSMSDGIVFTKEEEIARVSKDGQKKNIKDDREDYNLHGSDKLTRRVLHESDELTQRVDNAQKLAKLYYTPEPKLKAIKSYRLFPPSFLILDDPTLVSTLVIIIIVISGLIIIALSIPRILFYPFQLSLAFFSIFKGVRHPIEWDELTILPLPRTQRILTQRLQQDEKEGLHLLLNIVRNPFQRWVVQKVLARYLYLHSTPLHFLYLLLIISGLKEYVIVPMQPRDWEQNITATHLFLGELALRFVITKRGGYSIFFERLVWWISYPLRKRRRTPLTHFARMLYDLLDEKAVEAEEFKLSSYSEIYNSLLSYPDGKEITQTFDAMATFLSYNELHILPETINITSNLIFDDPIRATVLTALNRLGQVGAETATYQDSTSRANQMAALARATDALKQLDEYVQAEVMAPEQYLLRRIIRQWQALIIEAGGELGRAEVTRPVANPYVAGNPVTGELFVGREDILRRLEELWRGTGQKPSVVLYGHRRMGKSSILHNLGARFGKDTVIVDFNMQRVGLVASTGELLYNLALAVYDTVEINSRSLPDSGSFEQNAGETPALPGEPEEERFTAHNPYTAFDRFLKQVDRVRGERRFIITVDEFELIEQKIKEGKLEAQLLDFWRGVIQTYPWFVMAFAGLHTLQEMTRDYWHPLFGSVTGIPVSFLKVGAAKKLITQPTADFDLDYDADAIERIIELTYGQPYLVQLICHCLVTCFNRQSFEEGVERERRFSLVDVEAVINAPEFYRDGDAYFTGVWRQAETDEATGQQDILRVLAQSETGKTIEELAQQLSLALEDVQRALEVLKRHDVVMESEGSWQFTVELMRRWIVGIERGPFDFAQNR